MIAVIGLGSDSVLAYFAEYLLQQNQDCVFLNQNELGSNLRINSQGFTLQSKVFKWSDISVVYSRIHGVVDDELSFESLIDLGFLHAWLDHLCPKVINKPRLTLSNDAKWYQLECLDLKLLKKPISYMGANTYHPCNNQWVYKSASSVRSKVSNVKKRGEWVSEPVLFQEHLKGDNVRVHVVGDKLHAMRIYSSAIDYRYCDQRSMSPTQLPKQIQEECFKVAKQLELIFCGIDLVDTETGWYLLEVNPQPGYPFFDEPKHSISQLLYKVLI
ncbi:MAG TPA: ATP-grasp domain-containing protein [Gammaproteobacteria bacterium]|nr:ATP-grasp domain-containing protein [Gammaproteobacteria bacterium]